MKSTEEWVTLWRHDPELDRWRYDEIPLAGLIRTIQRDALLAASEIARKEGEGAPDEIYEAACRNVCDAILERSREI